MDKLRAAYRVAVIIGLVIMASLLVYAVIVGLFENRTIAFPETPALSGNELEIVKFALLGVSIIIFFLIRFVNARILAAEGEQGKELDPRSRQMSGAPPEFQRLTTAAIITYALCETPAIFGLVLFFLGRNASDFHRFLLISLFFFAVNFPKFSQWEAWYRKQQGQGQVTRRT
jgi:hypothetical protein